MNDYCLEQPSEDQAALLRGRSAKETQISFSVHSMKAMI